MTFSDVVEAVKSLSTEEKQPYNLYYSSIYGKKGERKSTKIYSLHSLSINRGVYSFRLRLAS